MSLWTVKEVITMSKLNQKDVYIGASAPSNPTLGMLWYDTAANRLKEWDGSSWVNVGEVNNITEIPTRNHHDLQNLGADDHTQYLHLNKLNQTLQQDLALASGVKIDGVDLSKYVLQILWWHAGHADFTPGQTGYPAWGRWRPTNQGEIPAPENCVAKYAYVKCQNNTLNGDTTVVLRVNGVDTALVITIPAGQTGIFSDTTTEVSIVKFDRISWRITAGGTSGIVDFGGLSIALLYGVT